MDSVMLSPIQAKLLAFIDRYVRLHGQGPSFDEMGQAIGLRSKGSVCNQVRHLAKQGRIRVLPHRARAIEVVRPSRSTVAMVPVLVRAAPVVNGEVGKFQTRIVWADPRHEKGRL